MLTPTLGTRTREPPAKPSAGAGLAQDALVTAGGSPRASTATGAGVPDRLGDPQSPFRGTKCRFYIPWLQRRSEGRDTGRGFTGRLTLVRLRLCSDISVLARAAPLQLGHLRPSSAISGAE